MTTRIKIRSIYGTALTKLLLDSGYAVVQPSSRIRERFLLEPLDEPHDILIQDRQDLQGVELLGVPELMCQFLTFLQERLIDCHPGGIRSGGIGRGHGSPREWNSPVNRSGYWMNCGSPSYPLFRCTIG